MHPTCLRVDLLWQTFGIGAAKLLEHAPAQNFFGDDMSLRGEILQLKEAINTMVDQLNGFASEVTCVAREVGTEGKLGGQAAVHVLDRNFVLPRHVQLGLVHGVVIYAHATFHGLLLQDLFQDQPLQHLARLGARLAEIGGKGLFVREIEEAVLAAQADGKRVETVETPTPSPRLKALQDTRDGLGATIMAMNKSF